MKILVLGAGAVGGYFGGRLAEAGADVTFLVRPQRAATLAREGLRIKSRFGDVSRQVQLVTQDALQPGYDLVILTAKAYDLESAIEAIAPAVQGECMVLPLLNGMAHLAALDARFGRERLLGGVAYIASTLGPDGGILHLNEYHRIAFGVRGGMGTGAARAAQVCESFAAAVAKTPADGDLNASIEQAMWDKWVLLASIAGMTCLMRAAVCDIVAATAGEKLMLAILAESAAVAQAEGFAVGAEAMARHRSQLTAKGSTMTASMLRDVENGGRTEADHVLGAMLVLASRHSLAAPLLETAYTHLQAYAARRARA